MSFPMSLPLLAVLAASFAAPTLAQCGLAAGPGDPVSMPRGSIECSVLWDPDGAGPAPVALVVGGAFTIGAGASQVAMWDGTSWTSLGQPNPGGALGATAITVWNGDLVVGVAQTVYRRTGGVWTPLGSAVVGAGIAALTVFNNDLVVGGNFLTMNGTTVNCVARWNGTTWSALGTGIGGGSVRALAVYTFQTQSALWVGGSFTQAGGLASNHLAVWTGSAWFATPGTDAPVNTLAVRLTPAVTTSYLLLGGEFSTAGGVAASRVARYSIATNTWSSLGAMPSSAPVTRLFVRSFVSSYEVVAAQEDDVSLWAGSGWNFLGPSMAAVRFVGSGLLTVRTLSFFGGRYVVGSAQGSQEHGDVRSFDGVTWQTLDGVGIPRPVRVVLPIGDDVVIGGAFTTISGVTTNGIARGGANAWLPLGNGVTGGNGSVDAIVRMPNGDLVAGGTFSVATGGVADHIARWNGTNWQPLGIGTGGAVRALVVMPNGDLIAGGTFQTAGGVPAANIARWNGIGWSDVTAGCNGPVDALCVLGNGDLIVGGEFYEVGTTHIPASRIARWNGYWQTLGQGVHEPVFTIAATANNGFVIGGGFFSVSMAYIAAWNGSGFSPIPYNGGDLDAPVRSIAVLQDGSLIAAGGVQSLPAPIGSTATTVVRLPVGGSAWEPLLVGGSFVSDIAYSVAVDDAGELVVGGWFHAAGTAVAANVARLASTCPASANTYGSGCTGSGGTNALAATTLPWNGTTLRTHATGMPAQGVALVLFGFAPIAVPLAALLPEGGPLCDLLTTPDITLLGVPSAGVLDTNVVVASPPSLIGVTFFHQVLALQDFGVGPLVITATNGLALTGGSY